MCLAGNFPSSLPSCSGNRAASHAPPEPTTSFIVLSEGSCCGRKVTGAVPKDSSEHRLEILKHNLNLKKKREKDLEGKLSPGVACSY